MAEPVYIIPKSSMHAWLDRRCLPDVPPEVAVDLSHARDILREELEAMDVWQQFKDSLGTTWNNFLKAIDQMGREEDSGKGQGEGLSGDSEEEGKPTIAG